MILDQFSLKGKTAFVTGSSRGLGAGIALAFAEAGARVAVHGSREIPQATVEALKKLGNATHAVVGDVSKIEVCTQIVEEVLQAFEHIDILVNNAGTIKRAPAVDHPDEYWQEVIDTNLTSVFKLTKLVGKGMLERKSGKIINIASMLTFQGGITVPGYAAAKGGVGQLTKAFANEWASSGINVNAIAPGYMATDNTEALRNNPDRARQILERIPAGRWGTPADLAGTAVFLASGASDYLNGHIIAVDGGWLCR